MAAEIKDLRVKVKVSGLLGFWQGVQKELDGLNYAGLFTIN